jgi:hypothetical protein
MDSSSSNDGNRFRHEEMPNRNILADIFPQLGNSVDSQRPPEVSSTETFQTDNVPGKDSIFQSFFSFFS